VALVGFRTRILPASSSVPQPTEPTRPLPVLFTIHIFFTNFIVKPILFKPVPSNYLLLHLKFNLFMNFMSSLFRAKCPTRGFGGLGIACWPLVPKFAGSNPAEAVGFLRAK
jgi:hypothetical protein